MHAVDCAPVVPTPAWPQQSGLAGIVCLYGRRQPDYRRRCGVTLIHTLQSLALRRPGSSCPLAIGWWLALLTWADLAITHFDHMFPRLTAELVCEFEYVTKKKFGKRGQLFVGALFVRALVTTLPDV